jgi:predicted nucleic acid-binding protein
LGLADDIPSGSKVAFDTDSLIYYVEEHPLFMKVVEPGFDMATAGEIAPHVSLISLVEVLVLPLRQNRPELIEEYREIFSIPSGFETHPLTPSIAERAAQLRARWNLGTPDAIIAATALEAGCTHLVTNDTVFRRVEDLKVLVVSDYV